MTGGGPRIAPTPTSGPGVALRIRTRARPPAVVVTSGVIVAWLVIGITRPPPPIKTWWSKVTVRRVIIIVEPGRPVIVLVAGAGSRMVPPISVTPSIVGVSVFPYTCVIVVPRIPFWEVVVRQAGPGRRPRVSSSSRGQVSLVCSKTIPDFRNHI